MLILVFAIWFKLAPSGGWDNFAPRYMLLPMALLVFINVATIARVMRGSMIEVLSSNFIRTARAKGLPTRTLVLGLVVLVTVITVVFNLLVDLAYALLDPKIRY
jgi:oligopeptide transport system permease protein